MNYESDFLFTFIKVIVVTSCTLGMMSSLTDFKYPPKKVFIFFGIYLLWVGLSTIVLFQLFGFDGVASGALFTISAPAIYLAYRMDKNSPAKSVFNYATQIALSLVLTIIAVLLNIMISGNRLTDILIRLLLYLVVIFIEFHFLRKPFYQLVNMVQVGWGLLSLIPVSFSLLIVLVSFAPVHYINSPVNILYFVGALLTMIVVYFVIFQSLMNQYKLQMLYHDKEVLQIQVSNMNKQADAVFAAEEKLRVIQHDVRHFTKILQTDLHQEHASKAALILSTLENTIAKTTATSYCDNFVINSILTFYLEKAEKEGIKVKVSFISPPYDKVDATAFSVMLANALENAVDACKARDNSESIELKARIHNEQYLMELSNTCVEIVQFHKNGLPQSQKGVGHGIGTRSILAFAQEQHATVNFYVENNRFIVQMILDLEEHCDTI